MSIQYITIKYPFLYISYYACEAANSVSPVAGAGAIDSASAGTIAGAGKDAGV